MIPLSGQRVVITGAAQGLGAAIARVFARAGADLVLVDLSAEGLAEVGAACGGRAKLITADLADAEAKGRRPQSDAGAVLFCLNRQVGWRGNRNALTGMRLCRLRPPGLAALRLGYCGLSTS